MNAGAGSGLNVLLNIEQYEYMSGPSTGAGVTVLIHSQEDVPLVKDNGVSFSKGSYSFVGLKHMKVRCQIVFDKML